ncbi:MAG: hypothetical protein KF762_17905 [Acidobacteria bacterium]|nr:hypothetical protein [Acidobacteriota bacterium]
MNHITEISRLTFGSEPDDGRDLHPEQLFDGPYRRVLQIKMREGAVLKKHKAAEPITVLCLAGNGTFRAGPDLEDSCQLTEGTMITLEAEVEHEAVAESGLHLLVTKFKAA